MNSSRNVNTLSLFAGISHASTISFFFFLQNTSPWLPFFSVSWWIPFSFWCFRSIFHFTAHISHNHSLFLFTTVASNMAATPHNSRDVGSQALFSWESVAMMNVTYLLFLKVTPAICTQMWHLTRYLQRHLKDEGKKIQEALSGASIVRFKVQNLAAQHLWNRFIHYLLYS